MPGKNGGPFGFGTSLLDDSDVQVIAPQDGQILTYSAALGKWINGNSGGGGGGGASGELGLTAPGSYTTFTQLNAGGSTVFSDVNGCPNIAVPTGNGNNLRGLYKGSQVAPYTVTAKLFGVVSNANFGDYSLFVGDVSTGKLVELSVTSQGEDRFLVGEWTNPTTFSTTVGDQTCVHGPFRWMQIHNDGTNLTFSVSQDGFDWFQVYTQAVGAFLSTRDMVGFVVNNNNAGYTVQSRCVSWQIVNS